MMKGKEEKTERGGKEERKRWKERENKVERKKDS